MPEARLIIGGGICESLIAYRANGVILKGYVDDIASFYKLGDIAINPVFQGTGLKVKTFEALSFGKIVVTHKHSIEGIYNKSIAPIFSADKAQKYSELLINALKTVDRNTVREQSIGYINQLNSYINSEYDKLLDKK